LNIYETSVDVFNMKKIKSYMLLVVKTKPLITKKILPKVFQRKSKFPTVFIHANKASLGLV
jgi:hypothetical protein